MSKSILLPASSKLFQLQQRQKAVFKRKLEITPEFNGPQDPLSYRDTLPVPDAAQVKTGFAFIDTSIRLIYEKKGDTTSPVKGIRFNSFGVEFRIEKGNILGETPTYETTVLTNEKNAQVSYRMTPDDIAFSLTCMANECDLAQDKKLAALHDLFKDRALTFTPQHKKLETKENLQQEMIFEFAQGDKEYLVEAPLISGVPRFWVKGFDAKNISKTRQMTHDEVNYSIDKIIAKTSIDKCIALDPLFKKMREYMQSMTDKSQKDQEKNNAASTRGMNL